SRALRSIVVCGRRPLNGGVMLRRTFTTSIVPVATGAVITILTLSGRATTADHASSVIAPRVPCTQLRAVTTSGGFDLENAFTLDSVDDPYNMWDVRESSPTTTIR